MKTLKKSILTLVALSAPKPTGGLQCGSPTDEKML